MARPASIVMFERLYLGAWLVGLLNSIINWGPMQEAARVAAGPNPMGDGFTSTIMIGSIVFGAIITLLLWYFTARRASDIAKWIVTVFFALGLGSFLWGLANGTTRMALPVAIGLVALVLQGAAVVMLFRPDAKRWFGEPPAGTAR